MAWQVSFHVFGVQFSPKQINFNFTEQNEVGDTSTLKRFQHQKLNYGSAHYNVPKSISRLEKFKHLADTFEPLLEELKACGAEQWHIQIDRLYHLQCNEELGGEEIAHIARLQCPLTYSAYSVSETEEQKGFDD